VEVKIIDMGEIGGSQTSGWLHAKTLFVDGERAYVGSANCFASHMGYSVTADGWTPGATRDLGIVFESPEIVSKLENIFETAWNSPYARELRAPSSFLNLWILVALLGAGTGLFLYYLGARKRGPSPPSTPSLWYLYQDGVQYWPGTLDVSRKWKSEGRIKPNALVWTLGMPQWTKIDDAHID